ncbi:MFS transporter, partial [Kitasatospora sp. MBT63]|uniref:MFS transporter n=1 Tax=Kitasatospora sp. MBT63 TaxID=1444768 RepID=UPI0011EA6BAF
MTSPSASRTLASPTARSRPPLPRSYLYWLAGAQASVLGDAVLSFALGWAAAAHGGRTAALVLTAVTVPRTLLLLPGGAVADRFGARRVLITGDAVLLAATLALAATLDRPAAAPWLLVLIAAVTGTVDAFHLPATGSMPRRLVSGDQLPRALAVRQAAGQAAALLGAPLGAVLVSASGLRGAALADAATFAVVLAVLVRIRPADAAAGTVSGAGPRGGTAGTVRRALADPVLRPALLLTAAAAGGLLPVVSLLGPL